jgi:hypothetical protein
LQGVANNNNTRAASTTCLIVVIGSIATVSRIGRRRIFTSFCYFFNGAVFSEWYNGAVPANKIKTASTAQFVRVRIAGTGTVGSVSLASKLQPTTAWQDITIALTEFGAAAQGPVTIPFSIEAVGGTPAFSALVDQIYYSKP